VLTDTGAGTGTRERRAEGKSREKGQVEQGGGKWLDYAIYMRRHLELVEPSQDKQASVYLSIHPSNSVSLSLMQTVSTDSLSHCLSL